MECICQPSLAAHVCGIIIGLLSPELSTFHKNSGSTLFGLSNEYGGYYKILMSIVISYKVKLKTFVLTECNIDTHSLTRKSYDQAVKFGHRARN